MHDGKEGRGADWFLAHFNLEEDNTVGIEYPPPPKSTPTGGAVWTQGGCLTALAISVLLVLGLCWIGAEVIK